MDASEDHREHQQQLRMLEAQLAALAREIGDARIHHAHEIGDLKEAVEKFCVWMRDDSQKSSWFYQAESDLRQIVETNRWLTTTKRVLAWIGGGAVGIIMVWNAVEIWIRDHL